MIELLNATEDKVIRSSYAVGVTTYKVALQKLHPLLNRFNEQRKAQSKKFYDRLRADILRGCVMPPITLAFVNEGYAKEFDVNALQGFINHNIEMGYILDGMQRLITLGDASANAGFDPNRPIYVNVIVASRYDLLLYRMITLNNGQKPMTARHQIEMLTKGAIDLAGGGLLVATEKQSEGTKIHGAFKASDISEAYTAYLSGSPHNQNSKIIESKLDEILVGKVMEANVADVQFTFSDILSEVARLASDPVAGTWLRQLNNLIGFTLGAKESLGEIRSASAGDFASAVSLFESAFDAINPSKVNVGKYRRELSAHFIEGFSELREVDRESLERIFVDLTLTE